MGSGLWPGVNALYQIYPRSFYDSNGDGIGDIPGIIQKLDYIKSSHGTSLGIDAVWLSPVFASPQVDCGYDITNYYDIDPLFGRQDDMRMLLHEAHRRGIKVMLDLVPNHTSTDHPWFQAARVPGNHLRDFYIWHPGAADGGLPNNWLSMAGGSAWQYDARAGAYYLHSFTRQQADLNWDNPRVRQAIYNVVRYWLDMGVDGFRVDAVWPLSKDPQLRDNPPNPDYDGGPDDYGSYRNCYSKGGPYMLGYLRELSDVLRDYQDRIMVFEFYPDEQLGDTMEAAVSMQYINPCVAATFYFDLFQLEWWARRYQERLNEFMRRVQDVATPFIALGNHDQPRIVSKYGPERARLLAVISMSLPGKPVVYYGEEIGMENGAVEPHQLVGSYGGHTTYDGRDPFRTPLRWNSSPQAGFTTGQPWLPVGASGPTIAEQVDQAGSFWRLYRHLLYVRSHNQALRDGRYSTWCEPDDEVLMYKRTYHQASVYILANFTDRSVERTIPARGRLLISSHHNAQHSTVDQQIVQLQPFEAVIIEELAPQ